MPAYWISENGTGDGSTQSTPANVATHNSPASGPSPGDTVLPADSDNITSELDVPNTGTEADPIVYELEAVQVNPAAGQGTGMVISGNLDWITVNGLNGHGNGDDSYFETGGAAGSGGSNEPTIVLNDLRILSNSGNGDTDCDGISLNQSSMIIANRPYIRDCFDSGDPSSAGHQALTAHEDSVLIVNDPNVDNVGAWAVNTANSRIIINGGRLSGALGETLTAGASTTAASRLLAVDVALVCDGNAKPPHSTSTSSADALVGVIGGTYKHTGAGATGFNRGLTTFLNVAFDLSDPSNTFSIYSLLAASVTNFIGCDFGDVKSAGSYLIRADDGTLNIIGNNLNSLEIAGRFLTYDAAATVAGQITGNYFGEIISAGNFLWLRVGTAGVVDFNYNVCGHATRDASAAVFLNNDYAFNQMVGNTFINIPNVLDTVDPGAVSNSSYNSELVNLALMNNEVDVAALIAAAKSSTGTSGNRGALRSPIRSN